MANNNLKDPKEFASIKERIDALTNHSQGKWGKMDVVEMLNHLKKSFDAANGDLAFDRETLAIFLSNTFLKKLVIKYLPWPRNLTTAKSYLEIDTRTFDKAKSNLFEAMDKFYNIQSHGPHPLFGEMDELLWGELQYKHCNHHLSQFNV